MNLRIATTLAALAGVLFVPSAAAGATLPPQLVAQLEADRREAQQQLTVARRSLGAVVRDEQVATARAIRLRRYADRIEPVLAAFGVGIASTEVGEQAAAAEQERAALDRKLEGATEDAAAATGAYLDSDRRLRALQRASATEDDRDTTLGSWRFGSGGPSVSAASIDAYLLEKGSPLAGEGAAFLEAGVEHEVDPRLVVAIAGAESYFGIQTCAPFNAWGWGCPNSPFSFRDWAHAIDTITLGLREGYVDDGLTTVGEIHLRYAPPNAENDPNDLNYAWADNVARFLVEQGGDPEDIEGVLGPSR